MRIYIIGCALYCLSMQATYAFVPLWGFSAHKIIALIAERYLSQRTKQKLYAVLGSDLASASVYLDELRSNPSYKYCKYWHYATVPDSSAYQAPVEARKGQAIEQLQALYGVLRQKDFSKYKEGFALRAFIHILSDLHQPLHIGNGKDEGGNTVSVVFFGKKTNLHALWDKHLLYQAGINPFNWSKHLRSPSTSTIKQWQGAKWQTWVKEALVLRKGIYEALPMDTKGAEIYYNKHLPRLKTQLLKAGVRLAAALESLYGH